VELSRNPAGFIVRPKARALLLVGPGGFSEHERRGEGSRDPGDAAPQGGWQQDRPDPDDHEHPAGGWGAGVRHEGQVPGCGARRGGKRERRSRRGGERARQGQERGGEHGEKTGGPGPMVKLENFVIQLKAVDSERYVRVAFDLELAAEPDKDVIQARLSHIRDSIISYFSDRTLDELRGSDGMDHIKQTLLKRLDGVVPGHRIKAIYITDFIIQ
jgi:flagellar FliL protein